MYANKVEAHHVRRAAERLGKDYDKSPKAEIQSFAQALSSSEASSSKTKGKASAKAHLRQLTSQENQTSIVIYLTSLAPKTTTTEQQLWQHMLNPNGD